METRIVIRQNNYWAIGKTLADARARYWKAAHRQPTSQASICALEGEAKDIEAIEIDDVDGSLRYGKNLKFIRVQ